MSNEQCEQPIMVVTSNLSYVICFTSANKVDGHGIDNIFHHIEGDFRRAPTKIDVRNMFYQRQRG
ncbi:MAG TPA: hypothetical protein DCZ55_14825 [Cyanobacteria bacterium UBA11371]|nr:hypothetical protein [Cyanobacteria bacterium UBA11371]